jgi:hypothetical protein
MHQETTVKLLDEVKRGRYDFIRSDMYQESIRLTVYSPRELVKIVTMSQLKKSKFNATSKFRMEFGAIRTTRYKLKL